jgi:hypothetical protein
MRKLKLESLHVDSFETSAAASRQAGTVHAHAAIAPTHTCATYELTCGPSGLDCTYTCTKMDHCL